MSIPNLFNKIKGWMGIDTQTFMYLCVVVGVGVASFGFGRLSVSIDERSPSPVQILNQGASAANYAKVVTNKSTQSPSSSFSITSSLPFVASKNGKLYYTSTCAGAKRIKEENKIWFANSGEAEDAGYQRSSSC